MQPEGDVLLVSRCAPHWTSLAAASARARPRIPRDSAAAARSEEGSSKGDGQLERQWTVGKTTRKRGVLAKVSWGAAAAESLRDSAAAARVGPASALRAGAGRKGLLSVRDRGRDAVFVLMDGRSNYAIPLG